MSVFFRTCVHCGRLGGALGDHCGAIAARGRPDSAKNTLFLSNIALIFHKGVSISRTQQLQGMHAQTQEPWRGGASGLPAQ